MTDGINIWNISSLTTDFYIPKNFINHAVLLHQAFAHCAKFLTAASRRSLDRISIPVWLIILSDQLPIFALVGNYPTNKLIGRKPISKCKPKPTLTTNAPKGPLHYLVLAMVSQCYPNLWGKLFTRYSPVRQFNIYPKIKFSLTCMC